MVVSEKFASIIAEGASANKKYGALSLCDELRNTMAIPIKIIKISTKKLGVLILFLRNPFAIKLTIPNETTERNRSGVVSTIMLANAKESKLIVGRYWLKFGNVFSVSNRKQVKSIPTAKTPQKRMTVFFI